MTMRGLTWRTMLVASAVVVGTSGMAVRTATGRLFAQAGGAAPWTAAVLIEPSAFAKTVSGPGRPLVVFVGFKPLYRPGHIPGATDHGPAASPEGIADLKAWARQQDRSKPVVIYCGCCPFTECPNVAPAYRALREAGFKQVRVLVLRTNFATDWVGKGFPIERT